MIASLRSDSLTSPSLSATPSAVAPRIAGHEFGAAPIGVRNGRRRKKRAFDLDVVDVGGIRNAGFPLRMSDRGSDFPHLRHRPDFLRGEITRHGHAEGEPLSMSLLGSGAREQRCMWAQHALRAAGPHEGDTFQDLFRREAEPLRERDRIGKRSKAAREVVGAAISLRLADERDDLGGIDRSLVDQTLQSGNVVGAVHGQLVHANLHGAKPLTMPVA
jgi:hypothetical protein